MRALFSVEFLLLTLNSLFEIYGASCSSSLCTLGYQGIPETKCISIGCCWDDESDQCKEAKLCPGAYPGAPRSFCESQGCVFNQRNNGCYADFRGDSETQFSRSSFPESNIGVRDRSGLSISTELNAVTPTAVTFTQCGTSLCKSAYSGIPISKCIQLGCCWDSNTTQCKQRQIKRCAAAYAGASRRFCEQVGCMYDEAHHECLAPLARIDARSVATTASGTSAARSSSLPWVTSTPTRDFSTSTLKVVKERNGNSIESEDEGVQCPDLPTLHNGVYKCILQNTRKHTCFPFCKVGYYATNYTAMTCGKDGKWSTMNFPKCQEIECPPLIMLEKSSHSRINCTNGQRYNSTCFLFCQEGSISNGTDTKVCKSNGEWTEGKLQCTTLHKCNNLSSSFSRSELDVLQMTCTHNDLRVGTICNFACSAKYVLSGAQTLTCRHETKWDHDLPTCIPSLSQFSQMGNNLDLESRTIIMQHDDRLQLQKREHQFSFLPCSYQAILKVNVSLMTSFTIALFYKIPTFQHFQLEASGTNLSIKGDSNMMKGGIPVKVIEKSVFRHHHVVTFHILLKQEIVHYMVQRVGHIAPIMKSTYKFSGNGSEIIFGLNQLVSGKTHFFSHGLCTVKFTYKI